MRFSWKADEICDFIFNLCNTNGQWKRKDHTKTDFKNKTSSMDLGTIVPFLNMGYVLSQA
jgi:hypothetical protein